MIKSRLTVFVSCLFVLSFLLAPSPARTAKTQGQNKFAFYKENSLYISSTEGESSLLGADIKIKQNKNFITSKRYTYGAMPNDVLNNMKFSEGMRFYSALQSADENTWLFVERNMENTSYNLCLYDSEKNKEIIFSEDNSPDPNYAFMPIAWGNSKDVVYLEALIFGSSTEHEGIWSYNLATKQFSKLSISPSYLTTPVISPDGEYFIYGGTIDAYKDLHSAMNIVFVYDIKNERERIVAKDNNSWFSISRWVDNNIEKSDVININEVESSREKQSNNALMQPSFELPWNSGVRYYVSRAGTPAPSGSIGSTCFSNYGFDPHTYVAIDFDTPNDKDDPVRAAAAGTVIYAQFNTGGYGNLVKIRHSDNTISYYAHLKTISVSVNDAVQQGCKIGDEGTTGNSTGDHIHFEWRDAGDIRMTTYPTFNECSCQPHANYCYTSNNIAGTCSGDCTLTSVTPTLVSPGAGTGPGPIIPTLTPTLTWTPVPGATNYGVYVRDILSDTLVVNNDCATTTASYTVPSGTLTNNRQYRWNIQANISCGSCTSQFSSRLFFQTSTVVNYTIMVSASPSTGGTVSGGGTFAAGSSRTVTATANSGYTFAYWTENGVVSSSASYNFTLNANRNLVANFSTVNYTITASASPSAGGTVSGSGTFAAGSSRTLTATANSGYTFANWTENGSVVSSSASYTFTLNANRNLVANFTANPVNYTITVSASPSTGGTVSGGGTFASGSSRTVTATANSGYTFANWTESGSVVSSSVNYTFTLNGNRNLVANFITTPTTLTADQVAQAAYGAGFRGGALVNSIAVARAESGFVLNAHCLNCAGVPEDSRGLWQININVHPEYDGQLLLTSASYNASAAYTISGAAVDADWTPWSAFMNGNFVSWLTLARNAAQNIDSTVIRAITDRVSVSTPAGINVRPTAGDSSITRSVSAGINGTVLDGPVVAVIGTGTYRFVWWKIHWDDGGSDGWSVEDYMVRTTASPNYTITVSASPSAGGTVSGGGTFTSGSSRTVTATANSGYTFVNWTENGSVVSSSASYTFTLNGNRNLVANFTANPVNYTITVSASPSAGGTVSGGGTFVAGSSRTVTATPNSGYTFANWTESGSVVSSSASYAFTLNANRNLVANFTSTCANPISVSIPANLTGSPGSSVIIPVNVGDVTGRGVTAYQFVFNFNPSVVTPQTNPFDVSGTLSSGFTVQPSTGTQGRISIVAFGASSLSGSGVLLNLKFNVVGSSSASSDLTLTSFSFNEGTPCATTSNGLITIVSDGKISGTLSYATSSQPKTVPGVVLNAVGATPRNATTDNLGNYQLMGLGSGAYTVTPTKTGDINGIAAFDASLVAQCVAGIIACTPAQRLAGDASNNGDLSAFDASMIAQYVAGIPNPNSIVGTWKFTPPNRSYPSVSGNLSGENYGAVLVGDVSGNWVPSASNLIINAEPRAELRVVPLSESVKVTIPEMTLTPNAIFTIPITVGELTGMGVTAYDFDLLYDPQVLRLLTQAITTDGTLSRDLTVTANTTESGRLRVSAFGVSHLTGGGTLLRLNFQVIGSPNGSPVLSWRNFQFNEGTPQVNLSNYTRKTAHVSAASFSDTGLSSESLGVAFGATLAPETEVARTLPLPTTLAGTTVRVRDSAGIERPASLLFVSPSQVNYQIPSGTVVGVATINITVGNSVTSSELVRVEPFSPGLFTANANGQGVAAAVALRVRADGSQSYEPVAQYNEAQKKFVATPIDLGSGADQVFLLLFGTGVRHVQSTTVAKCHIGGEEVAVLYAGPQGDYAGLDQFNLRMPRSLRGRGEVEVILTVDGKIANPVKISIR